MERVQISSYDPAYSTNRMLIRLDRINNSVYDLRYHLETEGMNPRFAFENMTDRRIDIKYRNAKPEMFRTYQEQLCCNFYIDVCKNVIEIFDKTKQPLDKWPARVLHCGDITFATHRHPLGILLEIRINRTLFATLVM